MKYNAILLTLESIILESTRLLLPLKYYLTEILRVAYNLGATQAHFRDGDM